MEKQDLSTSISGPEWNIQSEYPSMSANEFIHDLQTVDDLSLRISRIIDNLQPLLSKVLEDQPPTTFSIDERDTLISQLQAISEMAVQVETLLESLETYANCLYSVDASNTQALQMSTKLGHIATSFRADLTPVKVFLKRAPNELIELYLKHQHTAPEAYSIRRARLLVSNLLSEKEERLLTRMSMHGLHAWGSVYSQISGALRCQLGSDTIGVAQASGFLRSSDEALRKEAWLAIQAAYKTQEIPLANVLNGLAGWRLEELQLRPASEGDDFLSQPIHFAGIERKTLNAMLEAVESAKPIAHRAMKAMARGLGKSRLDPWDLLASAPTPTRPHSQLHSQGRPLGRSYKEGLRLIHEAFASVDPSFADFVDMMDKNRWIEGRVLGNKTQGAYCTGFAKSRTPRVFQTYMGSLSDIKTLAHELGHAYHSWVMRDLPMILTASPMTLAETASIFAETVCADHLDRQSDPAERFACAWQDVEHAVAFLLNIPARFEFEKSFYERRSTSAFVNAAELSELTDKAWKKWYGDTLSQSESQFWMTKLHFSISSVQFYNFPYTFGYLFALSVYARKETLGREFLPFYNALLRDTGRMSAEELAMQHLGEDITKPDFWLKGLAIVERNISRFEMMLSTTSHSQPLAENTM